MAHPRLDEIKERIELLQPSHSDDASYGAKYDQILDMVLDKVVTDVSAFINHPPEEIPTALDTTIALMTSDFLESMGLLDSDEEKADKKAMEGVKSLVEGDTSVTYQGGNGAASSLAEALRANAVTGNYRRTLLHFRKLAI